MHDLVYDLLLIIFLVMFLVSVLGPLFFPIPPFWNGFVLGGILMGGLAISLISDL